MTRFRVWFFYVFILIIALTTFGKIRTGDFIITFIPQVLLLIGTVTNWLVVFFNSNKMPVLMYSRIDFKSTKKSKYHFSYSNPDKIKFPQLADNFLLAMPTDLKKRQLITIRFSIGDLYLYSGIIFGLIFAFLP